MPPRDTLEGQLIGGRLLVESVIGAGGMGTVYRAQHTVLEQPFAVKVIRQPLRQEPGLDARFRREARTASRVQHRNITSVFDFGHTESGCPYLVMEYVEGTSLAEILNREGTFALDRALPVLIQLADALSAAHRASVVHRDFKPGNIMVARDRRGRELIKVTDFGLAKVFGPDATSRISMDGDTFGSPPYMAPEQCVDADVDHRSDIYAFGIVAYEMVVGQPPFVGQLMAVLHGHVNVAPPLPSAEAGNTALAPVFDSIVQRCLAKKPSDRYDDPEDLLKDLMDLARCRAVPLQRIPSSSIATQTWPHAEDTAADALTTQSVGDAVRNIGASHVPEHVVTGAYRTARNRSPDHGSLSHALNELACIARDQGLGSPKLSAAMARKTCLDDEQLTIDARIEDIETEVARVEQLANQRESRLRVALGQLEQECRRADVHLATAATTPVDSLEAMPGEDEATDSVASAYNLVVTAMRDNHRSLSERLTELQSELTQLEEDRERVMYAAKLEQDVIGELLQKITAMLYRTADPAVAHLIREACLTAESTNERDPP